MSPLPKLHPLTGYLPAGIHAADHQEIYRVLVAPSHAVLDWGNPHRARLFAGYERLIAALQLIGIPTEQWIGGSFVSRCHEPKDIDVVHYCDAQAWQGLTPETRALIKPYLDGERTAAHCHCDSYFVPAPPPEHQLSADFQIVIAYWKKKLGHDEIGRPKGLISRLIETEQPTVNPAALEQTDAATT